VARAAAPLVRLAMFRDWGLSASLAMSAMVSTVVMASLVVGPFYLSGALGLEAALVGLVMSAGPLAAALSGVPAGRLVDRFGSAPMTIAGLSVMAAGCAGVALLPAELGVWGYVGSIVVVTSGYALFQAANNTGVMTGIGAEERGVVSGMLSLAGNLGLITGAAALGAVFAQAAGRAGVAAGMQATFGLAVLVVLVGVVIAAGSVRGGRRR
jgi:MFS family permease